MHQSVGCPNQIIDHLQISQRLCEHAFSEGSYDNLSVIMLGMNDVITKSKTHRETDNGIALDQGVDSDSSHAQDINHYRLPTGLAVGAQVDSFVVKKIIARTARSEVYLVEDNDQHAFVLKSPSLNVIADGHYLREFLKERKIGLSLSKHKRIGEPAYNQVNPNSVSSHDALLTSDVSKKLNATFNASNASGLLRYYPVPASSTYLYHLTEYIEGESLRVFMDRQAPCDIWQTYDLLTKIGMAVRVMHRNYLLHQDIKPENILLTQSGAVKLIDFGSASSSILKDSTRPPNGDLHYAAPEYYTDAPKGVHSDLFSIAVIGYELLTGELPFSSQDLMNPSASLIVPAERLRQNRVPATSQQALMRALHSSTQARYQAIGEFLQDFNPDNSNDIRDPEPLIVRHPLLVWHSICFIQFVIIISLLIYFL
jgi:protein phosphatase